MICTHLSVVFIILIQNSYSVLFMYERKTYSTYQQQNKLDNCKIGLVKNCVAVVMLL